MKTWLPSLFCLLLLFPVPQISDAATAEILALEQGNELLESELRLAKKPQIYFIFDLKNRTIFLKSLGVTFKEMRVENIRFWGNPVKIKPLVLLKKSALFKPRRVKIKPEKHEETETDKFEIKALELDDMPKTYRLTLDDNIVISVRSKPVGLFSAMSGAVNYIKWHISRPLVTIWNVIRNKSYATIQLVLNEKDAKTLYWSFTEKTEAVIYYPRGF